MRAAERVPYRTPAAKAKFVHMTSDSRNAHPAHPARRFARDALIFDLDGTLVDSVPDLRVALNRLLEEEGGRPLADAEVSLMVGDGVETLIRRGFAAAAPRPTDEALVPALVRRFLDHYEAAPTALTRCWPGVVDSLEALAAAGCPMAVCTNKPHEASLQVLDELGLARFFSRVVGQGFTPWLKPDGRMLLKTIEMMGVSPARAVMIGDSANDVKVARNAGIPAIVVGFGYTAIPAAELGADAVIAHFTDLPEALARLG